MMENAKMTTKAARLDLQEGQAILGVSAEVSQVSELVDVVNPFLYLLE